MFAVMRWAPVDLPAEFLAGSAGSGRAAGAVESILARSPRTLASTRLRPRRVKPSGAEHHSARRPAK
eukprot:12344237-Alexandrium_andersonii.AAC.1